MSTYHSNFLFTRCKHCFRLITSIQKGFHPTEGIIEAFGHFETDRIFFLLSSKLVLNTNNLRIKQIWRIKYLSPIIIRHPITISVWACGGGATASVTVSVAISFFHCSNYFMKFFEKLESLIDVLFSSKRVKLVIKVLAKKVVLVQGNWSGTGLYNLNIQFWIVVVRKKYLDLWSKT